MNRRHCDKARHSAIALRADSGGTIFVIGADDYAQRFGDATSALSQQGGLDRFQDFSDLFDCAARNNVLLERTDLRDQQH
jgi:hypothetical protein